MFSIKRVHRGENGLLIGQSYRQATVTRIRSNKVSTPMWWDAQSEYFFYFSSILLELKISQVWERTTVFLFIRKLNAFFHFILQTVAAMLILCVGVVQLVRLLVKNEITMRRVPDGWMYIFLIHHSFNNGSPFSTVFSSRQFTRCRCLVVSAPVNLFCVWS